MWNLSPSKLIHVGEEIADVLVYTVRLSDLCNIDLGAAMSSAVYGTPVESSVWDTMFDLSPKKWSDFKLDGIFEKSASVDEEPIHSHHFPMVKIRSTLFYMQSFLGDICAVFAEDGHHVVEAIGRENRVRLAIALANMVFSLAKLGTCLGISLSASVTDKICKNIKKYPKDVVKGSSAKYTEYQLHKWGESVACFPGPAFASGAVAAMALMFLVAVSFNRIRKL